jgi:hypothetical protein
MYLRRIVGNTNVASIADDAINRVGATAQVVRLIPRQDDRRLVNEIHCQILRLGRRFCFDGKKKCPLVFDHCISEKSGHKRKTKNERETYECTASILDL